MYLTRIIPESVFQGCSIFAVCLISAILDVVTPSYSRNWADWEHVTVQLHFQEVLGPSYWRASCLPWLVTRTHIGTYPLYLRHAVVEYVFRPHKITCRRHPAWPCFQLCWCTTAGLDPTAPHYLWSAVQLHHYTALNQHLVYYRLVLLHIEGSSAVLEDFATTIT